MSDADLKRAREISNKIATDAMFRQGSTVDTILQALQDVRNETIEECAHLVERIGHQYEKLERRGDAGTALLLTSGNIRALKEKI